MGDIQHSALTGSDLHIPKDHTHQLAASQGGLLDYRSIFSSPLARSSRKRVRMKRE